MIHTDSSSIVKVAALKVFLLCGIVLVSSLQGFAQTPQASASQTVTQALMDLRSAIPEKRRGSVMLLAKYPQHPSALPAIVSALGDPEPIVRRASVVSLGENIRSLNPLQASRLVGALRDEDPEVRLSSSAWLPQLVLYSSTLPLTIPQTQEVSPDRQALLDGIAAGLQDEQPLVRLKSMEALQYLRWPLPQEQLVPLLRDPDARVRLQTYQTLVSKLPGEVYLAEAERLHPDPDPRVRTVLAETLSRQVIPGSQGFLEKLSNDPVSEVQLQAGIGLFILNPAPGFGPVLESALMERDLEAATVFRVFNSLNRLPPERLRGLIEPMLAAESATVRTQAAITLLRSYPGAAPVETLLSILSDPAPEVRQQALRHLGSSPLAADPLILRSLPENPYEDVRRMALVVSLRLTTAEQSQLALRLLLDTVPEIRREALVRIIQLRPDNWPRLLRASLRDPAPVVRQTAAQALLDNLGPEGRQIAAEFIRDHPDADVSPLIRSRLNLPQPN